MTVGEVKLQIQNTYLIPADDQLLYFSGILLHNAHLLSSYGIGHHSNLEVVVVQKKNDDHPSSSQDTWDNEEACRGANKAERELRAEIRRMHSEIIRCHGQGRIQDDRQYYSLPVEPLVFIYPLYNPTLLQNDRTHTLISKLAFSRNTYSC